MDQPNRPTFLLPSHRMIINENESIMVTYILSVMSASCSEIVTYPFDLIKTRLQIQGEKIHGKKQTHRGMIKTALGLITEEGFFKLWQGLTPMIYRHSIYSGLRLIIYEYCRDKVLSKNESKFLPFWQSLIMGAGAGAFAQFVASPTDLVKVRVQMEGARRLMGLPPRIKGINEAFVRVYKDNGFFGLWKGSVPNMSRAALVNIGDLTAYDSAKQLTIDKMGFQDNWIAHLISSSIAGLVAALLSCPADVLKSRVMNQPMDDKGQGLIYKNTLHCLQKTFNEEGFFALYKGFFPTWLRLGPWAVVFWMSYEQFRKLFGFSAF